MEGFFPTESPIISFVAALWHQIKTLISVIKTGEAYHVS